MVANRPRSAAPRRALRVVESRLDELQEMALQGREAGVARARRLVHVEALVDLDLQAVASAAGPEYARTSSTPLYGSLTFTS